MGHLRHEANADSIEMGLDQPLMLWQVLQLLPEKLRRYVLGEDDEIAPGLLILVNGADVRSFGGSRYVVHDEDTVTIIPAIHGGIR
jgi:molybdopterin converting factor small subunit